MTNHLVQNKITSAISKTCHNRAVLVLLCSLLIGIPSVAASYILTNVWNIPVGTTDYPWMANDGTVRGLAYNAKTGHLLVVSRTGGNSIQIVNSFTGQSIGTLNYDPSVISGGTFTISSLGVTDDGVIYVGNLSTSTTTPLFKLYRWENEDPATVPTVAYSGDPANGANIQRWGDSFDLKGSGAGTQVVIGSRNGTVAAILSTTDGLNFTSKLITTDAGASDFFPGLFWGSGNTFWAKAASKNLKQFTVNGTSATTTTSIAGVASAGGVIAIDSTRKLAAIVSTSAHTLAVYDITDPSSPIQQDINKAFPSSNANGNGTGCADFGSDKVFALDSNNGIMAFRLVEVPPLAPTITTQPASQTVVQGAAKATITLSVGGTPPFSYQWQFNSNNIAGATNSVLTLSNVDLPAGGAYTLVISNAIGTVTSNPAILTVAPSTRNNRMTLAWQILPGDRNYIANDDSQRGLSFNPATTNLLVVSRTVGANIYVLNANNGTNRGQLNLGTGLIVGGTFTLNMIGVADDGVVYACNLTTDGSATAFKIYRWANDDTNTIPDLAFIGDPANGGGAQRWGDSFTVRGSGVDTQILAASRNGKVVAVFTTADGVNFSSTLINVADAANGNFGLSVAFDSGSSFWGRATGTALRWVSYDLPSGSGTSLVSLAATNYPGGMVCLGVDPVNTLLAAISVENPDNLRLYDISVPSNPVLLDQDFFATDNSNLNGTGAVDFGAGKVFALDTNNGILALNINPAAPPQISAARQGSSIVLSWTGLGLTLQSSDNVNTGYTEVTGATSPSTNSITGSQKFYRLKR